MISTTLYYKESGAIDYIELTYETFGLTASKLLTSSDDIDEALHIIELTHAVTS